MAAEGSEFGIETADLGGVKDAKGTLAEASAVAEDPAGAAGVGETEKDAIAGGVDR